ncbi:hypothetical protein P280DRAFT_468873 [Massarina eburnea CBS 473.64]|uniref:Uncharacterized protein n=1 Tax=Massarina eburnea CBS 473.64 TaxID=1395130 RepID=A0A6A6S064_9PLEO|nr:hypothetical protein P280DRAFT_468873 [Massarina eburnea CBS 473.64]
MRFTTAFAAILLAAPAFAAPVTAPTDVEISSPVVPSAEIFARESVCKPATGKDKTEQAKIDAAITRMKAATKLAHEGENACKGVSQFNSANKTKKEEIKKDCVAGYQKCITNRKKANKECEKAGGTTDKGHQQAVTVCQQQKDTWSKKVIK